MQPLPRPGSGLWQCIGHLDRIISNEDTAALVRLVSFL